jgi:hypothetical protein
MVDIDLRKLSAPVEALRTELDDAYKRLDAKWAEIETVLKKLPIPCSVSFNYSDDEWNPEDADCLVWKKWNKKKRICIVYHRFNPGSNPYSDYETTTVPYDEWSGQQRIDMLEHVPGLFEEAAKETKEFIEKTKK